MTKRTAPEGTTFIARCSVFLLCADDTIRDPESGRWVTVVEQGMSYGPWHTVMVRLPDGRQVSRAYRKTSRFNVYG